jgi:hypothetical protein
LISKVLVYNPKDRPKASELMAFPFFDELRQQSTKLPNAVALPDLFNFSEGEVADVRLLDTLIPVWYKKRKV